MVLSDDSYVIVAVGSIILSILAIGVSAVDSPTIKVSNSEVNSNEYVKFGCTVLSIEILDILSFT